MLKKYTVANWMEYHGIPHNTSADKYVVGQNLTYEQAQEIIRMIAQGMGFMEEHPGQHNDWRRGCDPYREVIFAYAKLIEARKKRRSNWDHMLWLALDQFQKHFKNLFIIHRDTSFIVVLIKVWKKELKKSIKNRPRPKPGALGSNSSSFDSSIYIFHPPYTSFQKILKNSNICYHNHQTHTNCVHRRWL